MIQLASWVMELIIPFPADLIISITVPYGPAALPVFIFAIAFDIMSSSGKKIGGSDIGSASGKKSLSHGNSTCNNLS